MFDRQSQQPHHVLESVVRHVRRALAPFNQHKLIRADDDVVFVLEQNDVVVRVDDARQMFDIAKRTRVMMIGERPRLRASNVRVEFYQIDFHPAHSR